MSGDGERPVVFFYTKASPFSNFHPASFRDEEGTKFFCSEQYMMHRKAILFGDHESADRILAEQTSPLRCKRLGRKVRPFDDAVWKRNARRIVADGVYLKFSQNESIRRTLLETGDAYIAEASPKDRLWGIGYGEKKAGEVPRADWGRNWLGKVLMVVRSRLRDEAMTEEPTKGDDGRHSQQQKDSDSESNADEK